LAISFRLGSFITIQLYGVKTPDPLTFAAVALAPCHLPTRRAAKTDPMVALRRQ
jgi:hypothetical protein